MNPSPHWKNSLSETMEERRKNRTVSVSEVVDEWLQGATDRAESIPTTEPKPEPTEQERITALKRAFHQEATRAVRAMGKPEYVYTEENRAILNLLCRYFLDLPTEIPEKKGVLLIGGVGCGKSLILQTFANVLRNENRFRFLPVISLCTEREALQDAEKIRDYFNRYGKRITREDGQKNHLCLDDLYKEERERAYSYGKNPVRQILNDRYSLIAHGVKTLATANNLPEEMEAYGPALVDRMNALFFCIEMEWGSWR